MYHHLRDDRLLPLRPECRRRPIPICFSRHSSPSISRTGWFLRPQSPCSSVRWRCPRCRKTFTDYPPFACPYKAYTLPQITERAAKYVNSTATSYRKGVRSANRPIYYEKTPVGKSAQQHRSEEILSLAIVAHSSLFHWVTALGRDALRQPEPPHADFAPASRKYTSEPRRSILIACQATCSGLLSGQAPATLSGA